MNWYHIKEGWTDYRDRAAERWPQLSAEALARIAGNRTTLMEELRQAYGVSLEQAGRQADDWADEVAH